MDKFKVGDKVRIIKKSWLPWNWKYNKLVGTVFHVSYVGYSLEDKLDYCNLLEFPDQDLCFDFASIALVYDGDEKSSWEECAWKPLNVPLPT
jgi:hypothetical protein